MTALERKLLRVRLTAAARKGLERGAVDHGASLTALVEAMGLEMNERTWTPPQRVVRRARQIDRDRHSR